MEAQECQARRYDMNRDHIRVAVQNALVSLVSYLTGYCFTNYFHRGSATIGALWCMISAIVVLQATTRETLKSAMLRLFGTVHWRDHQRVLPVHASVQCCRDGGFGRRHGPLMPRHRSPG